MSEATLITKVDAIAAVFKAAVDAWSPPSGADVPLIYWDNVDPDDQQDNPPDVTLPNIRFSVIPNDGDIASLGSVGNRKFRNFGQVVAETRTPIVGEAYTGTNYADRLCQVIKDAFDGVHDTGVWFRRVRIVRGGKSRHWFVQSVLAEYQYDENSK